MPIIHLPQRKWFFHKHSNDDIHLHSQQLDTLMQALVDLKSKNK